MVQEQEAPHEELQDEVYTTLVVEQVGWYRRFITLTVPPAASLSGYCVLYWLIA